MRLAEHQDSLSVLCEQNWKNEDDQSKKFHGFLEHLEDICEYCSVDLVYDPVEIMDQVIEEVVSQLQEFHVTYQKMNQSERG